MLYLESDDLLNVHVYLKRYKIVQWHYVLQSVLRRFSFYVKNHMHPNPYAVKLGVSKSTLNHSPSKPMFFRFPWSQPPPTVLWNTLSKLIHISMFIMTVRLGKYTEVLLGDFCLFFRLCTIDSVLILRINSNGILSVTLIFSLKHIIDWLIDLFLYYKRG